MMFYVSVFLLPLAVLAIAGGLWYWNVRWWRDVQQEVSEEADLNFVRRQFRRRLQTSGMLAFLAVGLCAGQLIDRGRFPTLFVLFWLGMLLVLGWMVLLALGDLVVGRQHVARLTRERRIAEAQLNAELDRLRERLGQERDRNGQHAGSE